METAGKGKEWQIRHSILFLLFLKTGNNILFQFEC